MGMGTSMGMGLHLICVIPAKAHSRRLPGKNMRLLGGKPLLKYSIEAAIGGGIKEVRVTSDDHDILRFAESVGAKPVRRAAHLCGPDTPLDAIRDHAVGWGEIDGYGLPDAVMMLLPTYPFRSARDISNAVEMLASGSVWEVRSAEMIERCGGLLLPNSWLSAHVTAKGRKQPWFKAPPTHIGAWVRTDAVRRIDIDTEDDWQRAEGVIRRKQFDFETGETVQI